MPIGSALVFLMAGPATNLATIGVVNKTFGKRVLFLYLLVISAGSILLGVLFDTFFGNAARELVVHHHHGTSWIKIVSGAFFVALMAWYAFQDLRDFFRNRPAQAAPEMEEMVLKVKGMTCKMCVKKIRDAMIDREEIKDVSVDLESGNVTVYGNHLEKEPLVHTVEDKGYTVLP